MMQRISEIMTRDIATVAPTDSLQRAAQLMRQWNIGALPVCDGQRLQGMITDRDITIRATAENMSPAGTKVADVMSGQALWCFEDQTAGEILQQMGDRQIRRMPVVNRNMELVGIVSLGDLATRDNYDTDDTLQEISTPSQPDRPNPDQRILH